MYMILRSQVNNAVQGLRDATAALVAKYAPNAVYVPPFDHPDIMAGQGTIAVELLEQVILHV